VEDPKVFSMKRISGDGVGHCGWRVGVRVGVRVDLEEVLANEVWEVWVTNPLTKTMQALWVFPS
jgi:hypothetical protein